MSRRRGVVVSDNEEEDTPTTASSRQNRGSSRVVSSRRSLASAETTESSSSGRKKKPAKSAPTEITEEILNLPSVANYKPEEIQSLLVFKDDGKKVNNAIIASFNVISTSAEAVAKLQDPDGKNEVPCFENVTNG